jgi:opacity protein-like surface antigen
MFGKSMLGGAVFAALLASGASAQDATNEVVLFSKGNFQGSSRTIHGPTPNLKIPFVVKSVRIPEGKAWDFCNGNTFTGCKTLNASEPTTALTVRSARPGGMAVAKRGTVLPPGTLTEQSLRGVASEYFVAPVENGNRVDVAAGTPDAASARAAEFCRARGWQGSAHQMLQSIAGRPVLADVLCVRTGG